MPSASLPIDVPRTIGSMDMDDSAIGGGGGEGANVTNVVEIEYGDTMDINQPRVPQGERSIPVDEEWNLYGASPPRANPPRITPASTSTNAINTQTTAQPEPQAKTFHRFSLFPTEIRRMVWKCHAEEEENFGPRRTLTIIAKHTGDPKNNDRCTYVPELEQRVYIKIRLHSRAFDTGSAFPWVAQPALSYRSPASLYVNQESKDVGQEMYSKSHFLMSIFGDGKTVYFRKDIDILHFADWFTFSTFCLQYAFVQTGEASMAAAIQANRRPQIPTDEEDLPFNLQCSTCRTHHRGWNHQNPCSACQDLNPRERLDDHIKHFAIATDSIVGRGSFGFVNRRDAERYANRQTERMQNLRRRALEYINWSCNRFDTLVLGMASHEESDTVPWERLDWLEKRYKLRMELLRFSSDEYFSKIDFLSKEAFVERFGKWGPQLSLSYRHAAVQCSGFKGWLQSGKAFNWPKKKAKKAILNVDEFSPLAEVRGERSLVKHKYYIINGSFVS
ncbi:hypothetical protein SBOR_3882 [Sclerotinia borealis F-4128]|uniref:2EXR domain-containing protein n=1 Tax=Sclerotinia borealis (strain F-4128) TaxID=1432307 RepID=W9CIB8_SCLBF|nr:hypothetical protein SBOR_3882 [Sclerotinia borealis F-4128]